MRVLQSDNGGEFNNELMKAFIERHPHIKHVNSSPRHPQSNGAVEKANHTVKTIMSHLKEQIKKTGHKQWHLLLGKINGRHPACSH